MQELEIVGWAGNSLLFESHPGLSNKGFKEYPSALPGPSCCDYSAGQVPFTPDFRERVNEPGSF